MPAQQLDRQHGSRFEGAGKQQSETVPGKVDDEGLEGLKVRPDQHTNRAHVVTFEAVALAAVDRLEKDQGVIRVGGGQRIHVDLFGKGVVETSRASSSG